MTRTTPPPLFLLCVLFESMEAEGGRPTARRARALARSVAASYRVRDSRGLEAPAVAALVGGGWISPHEVMES